MTSSCLRGTVVRFFIIDFRTNCIISIFIMAESVHESLHDLESAR